MNLLNQLHFIRPFWLLLLPLLWGIVFWLMRQRHRTGQWAKLIDPELLPSLRLDDGKGQLRNSARGSSPWLWLLLAWTLSVLALAGPAWQKDRTAAYSAPASWVLIFDLSPSMSATDVSPSRYIRARYAIDDLLGAARDAHVGLIAFSDEPYTVTPITEDVATIRSLLPSLSPDMMPAAGHNLAPALNQAAGLLKSTAPKQQHVVVFSDGFDDPAATFSAAARLKAHGATVDVVGIGTSGGAPIPNGQGGFVQDAQGHPQLTKLDSNSLQQLAAAGGGQYVDIDHLSTLISHLQNNTSHDADSNAVAEKNITVDHWQDAGIWLLPLILICAAMLARRGWLL